MTIFLPPVSKRIPAPDTYYETQYNDDKYDWDGSDQNHSLARDGRSAFYAGDYGYAIYFFSQFQTNIQKNQNMSLGANIPLLAAAKFHQNPTLAGYKTFINDLNNLADEIQKQLDGQHGWFTNSIVIPDTQKQLKAVERLLSSPTEKRDVQNVIDRIDTIVSANQK